jgi:hypothetical protein
MNVLTHSIPQNEQEEDRSGEDERKLAQGDFHDDR